MIIPIKCFTCGNVLANKYRYYQQEVLKMKTDNVKSLPESEQHDAFRIIYLTKNNANKTSEGIVLDNIGLKNVCCRRHMLTHVDIQ